MGRKSVTETPKEAISTRLYADTVRVLRLLAESRHMSMADYVEQLAQDAILRDGPHLTSEVQKWMRDAAKRKDGE